MFGCKEIVVLFLLVWLVWQNEALRCRTEDGPSTEDIKKVVRTCMRRNDDSPNQTVGGRHQSDTEEDDNYEDGEYSDDSSSDGQHTNNGRHDRNRQRYGERERDRNEDNRKYPYYDPYGQNNGNGNQQQRPQQQQYNPYAGNPYSMRGIRAFGRKVPMHSQNGDQSQHQWKNQSFNMSNGRGNSSDDQGGSCLVQCFFQELQMTNREGQPDKHKMLSIMTKDIRDSQLREFYVDTIQECHRILEMEYARDKCTFARNLVTCMSERARSNCEDFQDSMLF